MKIAPGNVNEDRALLKVQVEDVVDDEREVAIRPAILTTVIETSKAVYHPREEIQLRLMTFDRSLRPVNEHLRLVWIENSRGLVVMQWNDVRTKKGIVSLSAPISDDNLFGQWKVRAITSTNVLVAEKTFRVQEKCEFVFHKKNNISTRCVSFQMSQR